MHANNLAMTQLEHGGSEVCQYPRIFYAIALSLLFYYFIYLSFYFTLDFTTALVGVTVALSQKHFRRLRPREPAQKTRSVPLDSSRSRIMSLLGLVRENKTRRNSGVISAASDLKHKNLKLELENRTCESPKTNYVYYVSAKTIIPKNSKIDCSFFFRIFRRRRCYHLPFPTSTT